MGLREGPVRSRWHVDWPYNYEQATKDLRRLVKTFQYHGLFEANSRYARTRVTVLFDTEAIFHLLRFDGFGTLWRRGVHPFIPSVTLIKALQDLQYQTSPIAARYTRPEAFALPHRSSQPTLARGISLTCVSYRLLGC